jgi:exosortase family protein XrtF
VFASTYIDKWNKIPVTVKQFLLRSLAILIIWKIIYLSFLLPTRLLDRPLSYSVAASSAWVLNLLTHSGAFVTKTETGLVSTDTGPTSMPLTNIYYNGRNLVSIEDGCNALELFVLYGGFIVCMPALTRRKIIFIIGGILLIHVVNVLRWAGVAYIILNYPKYADFAHHYVFTFIVYGLIILLWLIFSKKVNLAHAETKQ